MADTPTSSGRLEKEEQDLRKHIKALGDLADIKDLEVVAAVSGGTLLWRPSGPEATSWVHQEAREKEEVAIEVARVYAQKSGEAVGRMSDSLDRILRKSEEISAAYREETSSMETLSRETGHSN